MSSKPTTDTSSGTRTPSRSSRSISAIAITSFVQQNAVAPSSAGTGSEAAAGERVGERGGAAVDRLLVRARVGERDPLVAEAGEVIDDRLHRGVLVDVDGAEARVAALERDDDHRHAAVEQLRRDGRARGDGREDDAVDPAADERAHLVGLGRRVVLGLGQEHGEAVAVGAPLDLQRDGRVERVQGVGDDDARACASPAA